MEDPQQHQASPTETLDVDTLVQSYTTQLPICSWLKVSVKDPTKRTTTTLRIQDTHVVYMVESRIENKAKAVSWLDVNKEGDEQFANSLPDCLAVWRRYSEFDLLRNYLLITFPAVILPPLPEKRTTSAWQIASVDKLDPEFIERRRNGLEQFLKRLCMITNISQDPILLAFLKDDDCWKEALYATNYQAKADSKLKALSASYRIKHPNSEFEIIRKCASDLENHISAILRARAKNSEHLYGIHKIHGNYGRVFSEWSAIEQPRMAEGLQKVGHYIDTFAQDIDASIENEEDFADQLKEYYGYCESLRSVCKKQELLQLELEQADDALESKKTERENLLQGKTGIFGGLRAKVFGAATQDQKDEKLKVLDKHILEAEERVTILKKNASTFEKSSLENFEEFQKQKVSDVMEMLVNYIITTIGRCKKSRTAWANIHAACDSM